MPQGEHRLRAAVLHVDRRTDLPLLYAYSPERERFEVVGYVRMGGRMLMPGANHVGKDTAAERDTFLFGILTQLLVSPAEARRIIRNAEHLDGRSGTPQAPSGTAQRPQLVPEELDGSHLGWPGIVVGLLCGLLGGWLLGGWPGAMIGAFVGASTAADLFVAGWQLAHVRSPHNYVEVHDTLAILMIAGGVIAGAVVGYHLGGDDFGRACGVFLGMAIAAFVLGLVAKTFSMQPFRCRAATWLGPLVVGGFTWAAYSVWHSPASIALAIVLGSLVTGRFAERFIAPDR